MAKDFLKEDSKDRNPKGKDGTDLAILNLKTSVRLKQTKSNIKKKPRGKKKYLLFILQRIDSPNTEIN